MHKLIASSVICGNLETQTQMQTTEVFLEDWLILKNSTSTERTGEGKRKKRQAPDSTILTEEHRHGARLTYTCGVARQFKNLTGLYDER